MELLESIIGIPPSIRDVEDFGVGRFNRRTQEKKCREIREIMNVRAKSARPLISVVVPMHKEARYILATMRSLAVQTNRSAEFILVSNGEPRGNPTQRIAEEAGFTVLHESKPGVGRARQCGLQAARGQIVVTTDADTLHLPDWLDVIATQWKTDDTTIGGFGRVRSLSRSTVYHVCVGIQHMSLSIQPNHFLGASEANSWFLREPALHVGGYDVNARYAEGFDLMGRLVRAGGKLRFIDDQRVVVYSSDRRRVASRMWAGIRYLFAPDKHQVEYDVVR